MEPITSPGQPRYIVTAGTAYAFRVIDTWAPGNAIWQGTAQSVAQLRADALNAAEQDDDMLRAAIGLLYPGE